MSNSIKIVNGEGDLRIEGSILFNGDKPVLGIDMLERPLYGNEVIAAYNQTKEVYPKRVDARGNLSFTLGESISDEVVSAYEMNYYMRTKVEKTLYSSSKITVDILEDQVVIDLIEPDQYTSSIDLQRVEKRMIYPGLSAMINLSVKYAKGSDVYAKDLAFEAFSYDNENSSLLRTDFVSDFGDVTVEYVTGIIRAVPVSKDVTECIISNCVVTYGR